MGVYLGIYVSNMGKYREIPNCEAILVNTPKASV